MIFLNYLWNIIKRYTLNSKNTKQSTELITIEEAPFITKPADDFGEDVIHFVKKEHGSNNAEDKILLAPVKMYLLHTMNDRLGPNDYCIGYEINKKDINDVLYL